MLEILAAGPMWCCMEKDDARYSTLEQLHERRKQVVRLHRKGYGVMQIVGLSGLSYEQRPEAVQAWRDEQCPEIEKRAKAEVGEIHWGDETALVNTDVRGRSYAPAGKTPVTCTVAGTRQKLSMIATVTNQGKTRWMIIDEAFNADKLIEFLETLVKDAGKKVFLILDNLRVHHSKPVKAWAAERPDKIELFYLPGYSPELNPEERLNADLKRAIGTKVPVRTKAKLKLAATEHMVKLEQSPERVKSFFQDPRVKYAA